MNDLLSAIDTKTIMFANDTTCLSKGKSVYNITSSIQGTLNHINDYAKENHLAPHPDKTKVILFASKRQTAPTDDLPKKKLAQRDVHYVNSFICLGFTLDVNLDYEMRAR